MGILNIKYNIFEFCVVEEQVTEVEVENINIAMVFLAHCIYIHLNVT